MNFFLQPTIFLLGASVGSFLNVLVWRNKPGKKRKKLFWWRGRSVCDSCGKELGWWENIPLLSFLFLKGKCRECHSPIPREYFLVELATGLIYLLIFNTLVPAGFFLAIIYYLLTTVLIFIFLYDLHYRIIPDWSTLSLIFLALLTGSRGLGFWVSAVLSLLFFLFLHLITKGRGMGLGDVKFAFLMGLLLGPKRLILALYFAFLTGAVLGVILILSGKKKFGQHIAFGPFLVFGTFVAWVWGEEIISFVIANFF